MTNMKYLVIVLCLILLQAVTSSAALFCQQSLTSFDKIESVWTEISDRLGRAKNFKEISAIDIGEFSLVQDNLARQKKFLVSTLGLAQKISSDYGRLEYILNRLDKAMVTRSISYAEYWLIHFAMQEVADFQFSILQDGVGELDRAAINYVIARISNPKFDLSQVEIDSKNENKIQKSFGLMHFYTDFENPRFSEAKKAKVLGDERIPLPFFQRGFDIVEINNLARYSRIRPVEVIDGVYEINSDGTKVFAAPMVDGRRMGVGKDASDHDFNHLGFEVSAKATRELGRLLFEGEEELSAEGQMVLNVIYFKAWHEWGINLSAMEPSTQWDMLLSRVHLEADMGNITYLGGDPRVIKSIPAIESTVQFLKKKKLPQFWQ